jgi:hypothetical protein
MLTHLSIATDQHITLRPNNFRFHLHPNPLSKKPRMLAKPNYQGELKPSKDNHSRNAQLERGRNLPNIASASANETCLDRSEKTASHLSAHGHAECHSALCYDVCNETDIRVRSRP